MASRVRKHEAAIAALGVVFVAVTLVTGYRIASVEHIAAEGGSFTASARELLLSGHSLRCEAVSSAKDGESRGTFIVHDGLLRADLTTMVRDRSGGTTLRHHGVLGRERYDAWSDDINVGLGVALPRDLFLRDDRVLVPSSGDLLSASRRFTFTCLPWKVIPRTFVIPDHVDFREPAKPSGVFGNGEISPRDVLPSPPPRFDTP